ncbi:DUF4331 domain-containing protein [Aggregatimonas sangjinii]|uniref:DUF4331 domain-containing protein n=1 Tax=Aggregatimonas sangjinii TaxID=2583587 RepID=A0A5B7SP67_9FLAO|nr:DUF4331 family protein [Aggregatimonas sangjinii]QCX00435.1 DUF4331 domain-containing protein [Aggregatimonas sangjinii]
MKTYRLKNIILSVFTLVALAACNNDDNDVAVVPTCSDGIMNGDETGIDCGGTCEPCETEMMEPDFSGTYAQADHMGRPGINTVLSNAGIKDAHNVTIVSEMQAAFQGPFLDQAVALHAAFGVEYENNILGLDATTLTSVLADDVLEVAPENVTTYFLPGEDVDEDGNVLNDPAVIALTGRTPQDDVIDVSLILLFGGMDGIRFSGQDTDDDGNADLPRLTSDGVGLTADVSTTFPYLGAPE